MGLHHGGVEASWGHGAMGDPLLELRIHSLPKQFRGGRLPGAVAESGSTNQSTNMGEATKTFFWGGGARFLLTHMGVYRPTCHVAFQTWVPESVPLGAAQLKAFHFSDLPTVGGLHT